MKFTRIDKLFKAVRRATGKMIVAMLMTGVLWIASMERAGAEVSTTTVQGTVYLANGHPGSGLLHVSWPAFMSANGQAIVADSLDVKIGEDGFMTMNLAPNQGAMPAGLFYTAVFYMDDGSVSTQYWVVPAAAQATLAQVQAQVMPAAQAVQVVDKLYVDGAIARLSQSTLAGSGGTLTGPLYLSGDPTQPLQAADKHYVDLVVSQAPSSNVNPATAGQVAVYAGNGTSISGISAVPVSAGGTGSATAAQALENLGGISANKSSAQSMAGPLILSGPYDSSTANPNQAATAQNVRNAAPRSVKEYGAKGDAHGSDFKMTAGSNIVTLVNGGTFSVLDVGKLIQLPKIGAAAATVHTIISGYTDSTHVTVGVTATTSWDGTSTGGYKALWATDDIVAINMAISELSSLPISGGATWTGNNWPARGTLYFPCGFYATSQQITIPANLPVEGQNEYCANLIYLGTSAVDATVEVGGNGTSSMLRSGVYLTNTNHPEIGGCTGAACSPTVTQYSSGWIKHVGIWANPYTQWALSTLQNPKYRIDNVYTYGGGAMGCFYNYFTVGFEMHSPACLPDGAYGQGYAVYGFYFDGDGAAWTIPAELFSPVVQEVKGTGLTFNQVGLMDVHGVQASYNHQTFNITSSSSRVSFYDSELEGGTIASVVAGAGNNFYNAEITDAGLTLSGGLNLFEGGTISHTVTITGKSNTFRRVGVPGFPFDDQSASTKFEDLWNYSGAEEVKRGPLGQRQAPTGTGGITPVTSVYGKWDTINTTTTPQLIASTNMAAGKAWKAIFIGTWESYGTISTIPPYLELTDTSNTVGPVPYVNITMTFSLNARGQLQMSSNGSDANVGFNGWVFIVPATQAASAGGTSSMQLAGNMKAASIQVGSGAVMAANHGTGMSVQHSDGTGTTGGLAAYAADGSVTAGPTPPTGALVGTTDTQTLTNKSIAGSEINSGTVGVAYGGTGQNESTATGIGQFSSGTYNVSTALANGTTATTQSAGDNSSKVATTSYVASPGAIAPTVVTATGIITGGNDTARTTAATIGTTAFSSTGLVLPTVPASTTKSGRCVVLWQMSSTSYTATFGIGMSNAPAGLWGGTSVTYAAAGTSNWLAFSQTATAPTSISTAVTAAAANTTYRAEIDFTLQTGSSNPVAITLYGLVSQASATLAIQPGSACYWLP